MTSRSFKTEEFSSRPSLSLVVATVGRTHELCALLSSISPALSPHVEVIVVDQNDEPLTSLLLPFQERLHLVPLRLQKRNANLARNLGAQHAQAEWLMFPDDDALFARGALEHLLDTISIGDMDLVSGQIVDEHGTPHLLNWPSEPIAITPETLERTLVESSFAIRRALFHAVDGFDPQFGPGGRFHSAEGADLVRRLWRTQQIHAKFTPAISLSHPAKGLDLTSASTERTYQFALGEGAFTARHYHTLRRFEVFRKLAFRLAGTLLCRGERRRRKIAFIRGFIDGFADYRKLHTI